MHSLKVNNSLTFQHFYNKTATNIVKGIKCSVAEEMISAPKIKKATKELLSQAELNRATKELLAELDCISAPDFYEINKPSIYMVNKIFK